MSLAEWDSFYIIVGPSAGALIGLQFVVMTLMADRPSSTVAEAGRSFATPTVMHLAAVLMVAALVRVPWPIPELAPWACGTVGLGGLIYMCLLVVRMLHQSAYTMDNEDRFFHVLLPFLGYGAVAAAGGVAVSHFELSLFGLGLGSLVLLFDGIHNAWDSIAWQVLVLRNKPGETSPPGSS